MPEHIGEPEGTDHHFTPLDLESPAGLDEDPGVERLSKTGILTVAESYAFAQTEMEDKLILETDPEEWPTVALELVQRYPALKPYEWAVVGGTVEMLERHHNVDSAWRRAKFMPGEDEPVTTHPELPHVEVAGPAMSRQLLADLGINVDEIEGPVVAERGVISIAIKLERPDLEKIWVHRTHGKGKSAEKVGAFFAQFYGSNTRHFLPVMFVPAEGDMSEEAMQKHLGSLLHEGQHMLVDGFETGQIGSIKSAATRENDDPEISKMFEQAFRNLTADSEAEKTYKKELDADFALIVSHDHTAALQPDHAEPATDDLLKDFLDDLTEGVFENDYIKPEDLTPELRAEAAGATEALIAIRAHYIHTEGLEPVLADKISAKMLRVLPLKSWPAAAKLIQKGRSQAGTLKTNFNHSYTSPENP